MPIKRHKPHTSPGGVRNHAYEAWDQKTRGARAIYKTPEWRRQRAKFLADNPVCSAQGCTKKATTVDHIERHQGCPVKFWDQNNWQPMCFKCHQKKRGRERHE